MIAVKVAVGPVIKLNSGAEFDFLQPWASNFTLDDIAHGLANQCRYAGQCRNFYSIAEHSLHVSQCAAGFELEALMHDAAEAFMGDITRPLKQLLPEFKLIETRVQSAIMDRFGLPSVPSPEIKRADLAVLAAEQAQLMPAGTDRWAREAGIVPAPICARSLPPYEAKRQFLQRFQELA